MIDKQKVLDAIDAEDAVMYRKSSVKLLKQSPKR